MMKGILRTKTGADSPFIGEVPIPKPTPGYVLIKVMAAPINPSDEYFSKGSFGPTAFEPYVCGFEGAGIITEVGEGVPSTVIGKKVTVWPGVSTHPGDKIGMWSQFARVPFDACVMLGDADNCEDYCGLFVNPLTLLAFISMAKKMKEKTIIHTGAASSLGKSLIKVGLAEGIDVICIVRRPEQVKALSELGAKYVLNQNDSTFQTQLQELCLKLNVHLAFDCVVGDLTPKIMHAMCANSIIHTYGFLSGTGAKMEDHKEEMLKDNKKVVSFVVMNDPIMKDPEEKKKALAYISDDIKKGGPFFKLTIAKRYKMEDYKEALVKYKEFASQGKTIFMPNA